MIRLKNLDPSLRGLVMNENLLGEDHWLVGKTSNAYSYLRGKTFTDLIHFDLASAMDHCTEDQNDRVLVVPGYTETITGVGGITAAKAGIDVLGLGGYSNMPAFLMDGAATVSMLVTAADVRMKNLTFKAGHADINYLALVTAKGFILDHCRIVENTTDENFVDALHISSADNDADGLQLIGNEIIMDDAACVTAIDLLKNINDAKILGNLITGDFDATPYAPIYMATAEVPKNILIQHNLIHNQHDGNAAVGISMACVTATGWIINNHVGHQDADGNTAILAGAAGLYVGENYTSSVLGTASGYLYPAADDGAA